MVNLHLYTEVDIKISSNIVQGCYTNQIIVTEYTKKGSILCRMTPDEFQYSMSYKQLQELFFFSKYNCRNNKIIKINANGL